MVAKFEFGPGLSSSDKTGGEGSTGRAGPSCKEARQSRAARRLRPAR